MLAGPGERYGFCGFCLDPVRRVLTRDGQTVPLTARLFDTLLFLVEHRGRFVDRDALQASVWAGRHVEEWTVGRTISSLRDVLREHGAPDTLITTASSRGYCLSAPVWVVPAPSAAAAAARAPAPPRHANAWRGAALGVAVMAAALAAWLWAGGVAPRRAAPFTPPAHSVAVLPFADATGGNGELGAALAEQVIVAFGRIDTLKVPSPLTSFQFGAQPAAPAEIGRRLQVGTVLEGSVRRMGETLHVAAHLTDTTTGYQIWSESYDRAVTNVFAVADEIARHVAVAMHVMPPAAPAPDATFGGSGNSMAVDAFLAGLSSMQLRTPANNARAYASFTEALRLDPKFVRAYQSRSEIAVRMTVDPDNANTAAQARLMDQAMRDAETAVKLAPESGAAHGALGYVVLVKGNDMRRAAAELTLATRLAPGDAGWRARAAEALFYIGQTQQALAYARESLEMDPSSYKALRGAAIVFANARKADEYHAVMRQLRANPVADPAATAGLECIYLPMLEEYQAAIAACQTAAPMVRDSSMAIVHWKLGHQAEARAALQRFREDTADSPVVMAEIYAAWGDNDTSRKFLTEAVRVKDNDLIEILGNVYLAPVRDTPEFDAAARSIGLR